jgi:hypothetical protein
MRNLFEVHFNRAYWTMKIAVSDRLEPEDLNAAIAYVLIFPGWGHSQRTMACGRSHSKPMPKPRTW